MPELSNNDDGKKIENQDDENGLDNELDKEIINKDVIPNFFPTYRIKRKIYPIPIIIVVVFAGILAYLTYTLAGI
ncbi:MAG: hypothetical protein ACFFD2_28030, partial [Promethearchaeota archaeon]